MPHSNSHLPALEGRTLLDELNHRIKNELASVINLVSFKAIWTDNIDTKEELSKVVDLLHHHVEVHNILTMPDRDALVDAGEQLRKLGLATSRCKLDRMNIHLLLSIDTLPLESERCWRLALAVYELVTNAVRHACFDGHDGEIKIELMRGSRRLRTMPTLPSEPVVDRGGSTGLRGVEALASAYGANGHIRNSYASYGYSHGYARTSRYWPYAAAAAYAYGRSYASSNDGCYYVSTYRRYSTRRVLVCHEN